MEILRRQEAKWGVSHVKAVLECALSGVAEKFGKLFWNVLGCTKVDFTSVLRVVRATLTFQCLSGRSSLIVLHLVLLSE